MTAVMEARGFAKTFAGRRVLKGVDLTLEAGEIHGFVGQNGCGKSTFIKILSGFHAPDPGAGLRIGGQDVTLPMSAGDAERHGLAFVHQDLGLVDEATVLENLCVGRYSTARGWRIRWGAERNRMQEALKRHGVDIDVDADVASLRQVEKARIAIVRAAEQLRERSMGVLVLDEPTAYLPADGIDQLFATIRSVAQSGLAVVFVTHRLEEIFAVTHRVTVLRDGSLIATTPTAELTEDTLVTQILGFDLLSLSPKTPLAKRNSIFSVTGLRGSMVRDFSLEMDEGEIVGATGLLGTGWEQVPYLLFGAESAWAGEMTVKGSKLDLTRLVPRRAIDAGLALVPANRLRDGVIALASAAENMTLATLGNYFRRGVLRHRAEAAEVSKMMEHFGAVPVAPSQAIGTFSGGNQQKIVLAKWFARNPAVLLMHEPTQGVDVGARRQLFERIRDVAAQGKAVLIASSEEEDLAELCHRVLVFRHGRVVAEIAGQDVTADAVKRRSLAGTP